MASNFKNKLADLTAGLVLPRATSATSPPAAPVRSPDYEKREGLEQAATEKLIPLGRAVPRTAPGHLMAFRSQMLNNDEELNSLREKLKNWDNSSPTTKLDPAKVHESRWANRHPSSFDNAEFGGLRSEIERAGGNIQPILVREIKGQAGEYEIVFGHRRHRACLELRLPVLAMIWTGVMADTELFVIMDRENRERADLSAYEQGVMYSKALDEGLYSSVRNLAESLGLSHTWVGKALAVSRLPAPVIEAFKSPLDIQYRHAQELFAVLENDKKGVLKRAEKLRGQKLAPTLVLAQLIGTSFSGVKTDSVRLKFGDVVLGSCSLSKDGTASFKLTPAAISDASLEQLTEAFKDAVQALRAKKRN